MSLPDLLDRAAARPSGAVDVDRLWQRGRRRRRAVQAAAGGGVTAVALLAVLALSGVLSLRPGVVLVPPAPPLETATAVPLPQPQPVPTPTPPAAWPDLTLAEAIDRLVTVNESAPAGPRDGARVTRSLGAAVSTNGGTGISVLNLTARELRLDPDGSVTILGAPIAEGLHPTTTPERLREIVAGTDLDALVLTPEHRSSAPAADGESGPVPTVDDMLTEAEALAATVLPSPLPAELKTERPPQASAANAVADALHEGVPSPQQRIRALRILSGLDPEIVQYGGVVRDLLGREGIAIVLLDPPTDGRSNTLVFSADTGEQLGAIGKDAPAEPGRSPTYSMFAVLSAEIRPG